MRRSLKLLLARCPIHIQSATTTQQLITRAMSSSSTPAPTAPLPVVKTEKARRHQHHLADVTPPTAPSDQQQAEQENGFIEWRGGPQTLEELTLRVVFKDAHYLVLNKGADERLDGDFQVTLEKAVRYT